LRTHCDGQWKESEGWKQDLEARIETEWRRLCSRSNT
jgi:hypothetical protein